jgi:hypothetical protein
MSIELKKLNNKDVGWRGIMEKQTFKVLVKKVQDGYIAKTVDFSYIAQGPSVDAAIECLVASIDIQLDYDLKNKIVPWSKHVINKKSPVSIFDLHKKYLSSDFILESGKKEVALELAHC